ncbi:MAG: ParB N-terminal domain-containing protein [Nitrososphaeraceae archaeon]
MSRQGLLQPIIVRPAAGEGNENYTIVAGNRRFNACKALGWMEIPSRIVEADGNGKTSPDKSFRPRERCEGTESGNWKRIQVFKPQSNHRILSNIFWKYCKKLTSTNRQSRRKGVKSPPTIFTGYCNYHLH